MARPDGRENAQLRPIRLTTGTMPYAEGSCLVEFGDTHVICTATVEERVPPFLKNSGKGWVTAEYAMLPRSCKDRAQRENRGPGGRSMEIQRLVGRSLRAITDTDALGERTIIIDCDVVRADGGTRTASVTGACVALAVAVERLIADRVVRRRPLTGMVAAVSVGVVLGGEVLDLCYAEDHIAAVDMNVIMTNTGRFVEVQGTAEGTPFDRVALNRMLDLAEGGIKDLLRLQQEALRGAK